MKDDFNNELKQWKSFFSRSFRGAVAKRLQLYIISTLIDDHVDAALIRVGTNDILNGANHVDFTNNITEIGKNCRAPGEKFKTYAIIRKTDDALRKLCEKNTFYFICKDMITLDYLWSDCIYLKDDGTNNF